MYVFVKDILAVSALVTLSCRIVTAVGGTECLESFESFIHSVDLFKSTDSFRSKISGCLYEGVM